jgi:DNA polymerase III delta prime subunit
VHSWKNQGCWSGYCGSWLSFWEDVIRAQMRLGDLLIRGKLVSVAQVQRALEIQGLQGGRLGDHLVAEGAITREALDAFLYRTPREPESVKATGVDENDLLSLLMKLIYTRRLESGRQFSEAIKLPFHVVVDLVKIAIDRKLLYTRGVRPDNRADMNYGLTEQGGLWAADALQRSQYNGPAPVTLAEFTDQVNLQKITNEVVSFERVREQIADLAIEDALVEQCGPALNSGRAMLLYGPPGNGKTTFALRLANVFADLIYMPYAIEVEGQIIRIFDPSIHVPVDPTSLEENEFAAFSVREGYDARWVPCKRPFVIAGGELTLEMLDLRYDAASNFYEAPLHMKALGGCFVIDDFGRQMVTPTILLNRWIVPLESRIDYLKLHTGKSFSIPFEELVMFSTNLEPEDLMDPAFLRRLPYKIEIGAPSVAMYKKIFIRACAAHQLTLPDDVFEMIVEKIQVEKQLELAAYQPKFIMDQVVASCRFNGEPPRMEPRFIVYAIDNLRVKRHVAA